MAMRCKRITIKPSFREYMLLSFMHPHVSPSWKIIPYYIMLVFSLSTVKPRKGDALLFFSLHPDASTDPNSLHGSCPVIEGEKWSATKWIHVRSFDVPVKRSASGECVDDDEHCPQWAAAGECQKNPIYMVGSPKSFGFCRKSCKVCSS